jgi:hypothetical protein
MKKLILYILSLTGIMNLANAQEPFLNLVPSVNAVAESVPADKLVRPSWATTTSVQSGEGIPRAYDGDMSTLYHSSWSNTQFPVTLDFIFDRSASQIDYLVYYPRTTTNTNGNFKAFELWYSLRDDNRPMVKYGDYDFKGSSTPSLIQFDSPLIAPDTIRFVVKSGESGFVSCAEMGFYSRDTSIDLSFLEDIFTDSSCSELKPDVTIEDIQALSNPFFRKLALDLQSENYDNEFRVQEYEAYPDPAIMAKRNKTGKYGMRDNPTGIYALENQELVVLVGETDNENLPSLFIQKPWGIINGTSYLLHKGINKISPTHEGLIYMLYYTPEGTENPVKINIATGNVNGYYDRAIHTDPGDWKRLLAKATYPFFDMKGRYAILSMETQAYRTACPDDGPEVVDLYDDLVYSEQAFEGMAAYNKMNPTRMLLVPGEMNPGVAAYATDYVTAYGKGSQLEMLSVAKLKDVDQRSTTGGVAWMLAHEIGHVNQTRPGLKWHGMTEVTNNILSQYITIKWGVRSRLQDEMIKNGKNRYEVAEDEIVKAGLAHNAHSDVFCKLAPFWQLKLYMIDVLGKTDFYKDVYEKVRVNPDPGAAYGCTVDGMCQLEFVRLVCEVSQLDMTEFFTDWGFLTPCDVSIDDYSKKTFTVSQEGINYIKEEIAKMHWQTPSLPSGKKLYQINDNNYSSYK